MKREATAQPVRQATVAVQVRKMPEPLHRLIKVRAIDANKTVEQYIIDTLQAAVK